MSMSQFNADELNIVDAELAVRTKGFADIHIAAAVKGSDNSEKAAAISARLCMGRNRFKHSYLHIDDEEKSKTAPRHLKPAHLEHFYDDISTKFRVPVDSTWVCIPKDQTKNESFASTLTRLADKRGVDVLILSRSKEKAAEQSKSSTAAGNASSILRECHASVMIVRHTMPLVNPTQAIKWFFSTDGSHAAASGFCTLINCLIRPGDIVDVGLVTSDKGEREVSILKQYSDFLRERDVEGTVKEKIINSSTTIPNAIIAACDDSEADVLVVGIADYTTKKLGSVSDYLLRHCPTSTLIIKDRVEASTGSTRGSRLSGAATELLSSELCRTASLRASRRATADSDWGVPDAPEASSRSLRGKHPSIDLLKSASFVVRSGSSAGQLPFDLRSLRRATDLETIDSNPILDKTEEEEEEQSPFAA